MLLPSHQASPEALDLSYFLWAADRPNPQRFENPELPYALHHNYPAAEYAVQLLGYGHVHFADDINLAPRLERLRTDDQGSGVFFSEGILHDGPYHCLLKHSVHTPTLRVLELPKATVCAQWLVALVVNLPGL